MKKKVLSIILAAMVSMQGVVPAMAELEDEYLVDDIGVEEAESGILSEEIMLFNDGEGIEDDDTTEEFNEISEESGEIINNEDILDEEMDSTALDENQDGLFFEDETDILEEEITTVFEENESTEPLQDSLSEENAEDNSEDNVEEVLQEEIEDKSIDGDIDVIGLSSRKSSMPQSQKDAIDWVNNLVAIRWGNTPDTYNYDGSKWVVGDYGEPQCVDLVKYYSDYLGCDHSYMNGVDANSFGNLSLPDGWIYTNTPEPGDILVKTGGEWGHVGIVVQVEDGEYWSVDTNGGGVYDYDEQGKQINEGATYRGPDAISSVTTFIHPLFELNDTEKYELQIIETAQGIYNQYANMYEYINWLSNQELYYRKTLNEADAFSYKVSVMTDYGMAAVEMGFAVLGASTSLGALIAVGANTVETGISEMNRGQPQMTTQDFIYSQACSGVDSISKSPLYDIYDNMEEGEFVSAEDALNFILIYKKNEAALASAEMGRQYYYDQINQSPWDYLGNLITSFAPSEIVSTIISKFTDDVLGSSLGVVVDLLFDRLGLISQCYENEHITAWQNRLKEIEKETEELIRYRGDTSGSSAVPTYTVHFDAGEGIISTSEREYPQGTSYDYLPPVYRLGYNFLGWYDDAGNKYTEKSVASRDVVLTAKWSREILKTGNCGTNLAFVLYGDGVLEITGRGEMDSAPWDDFYDRIGEVILPDGLTNIYGYAFSGCKYLHEINIPDSVRSIGDYAFAGSGIQSLTLPNNLETLGYAFLYDCTGVTELTVPGSVRRFSPGGGGYFSYDGGPFTYSSLEKIVFEEGIEVIDEKACCNLSCLKEVVLPSTLKTIGEEAFGNTGLTEINLPEGIESLGSGMISGCEGITSIFIPKTVKYGSPLTEYITHVELEDGLEAIPAYFFSGTSNLREINIPDSVRSIGDYAFGGSGIQSLTLPNNLEMLGYAFLYDCTGVTELTVPGSVRRFSPGGGGYFSYDGGPFTYSSLEKIVFEEGIEVIDEKACCNLSCLKEVVLPSTLKTIGEEAFGNTGLTEINLPEGIESLGSGMISGCEGITSIFIPKTVKYGGIYRSPLSEYITHVELEDGLEAIPDSFFSMTSNLKEINIPDSVSSIGSYAFEGSGIQSLTLPNNLESLGRSILADCPGVTELTVPGKVTTLYYDNYYGGSFTDSSLEKIIFEEGITEIYPFACYNLSCLKKVVIPGTLETIGQSAFANTGLTEINLPEGIEYLGDFFIEGCEEITSIIFNGNAPTISQNAFYEVTATAYYPADNSSWTDEVRQDYGGTITWSTESIPSEQKCGDNAYWTLEDGVLTISGTGDMWNYSGIDNLAPWRSERSSITTIIIEQGITSIGSSAFSDCNKVISASVPDSVTSIGDYAFVNCELLNDITIQDGLISIGYTAFAFCYKLTDITIPDSVTSIGDNAFGLCLGLKSINVSSDNNSYSSEDGVLFNKDKTVLVKYPESKEGDYTIPDSVIEIGFHAFQSCLKLSSVIIPDSVTSIGIDAFGECCCKEIYFYGNAPQSYEPLHEYMDSVFSNVTATAYYPGNNPTWTEEVRQYYGGNITWVPYGSQKDIGTLSISLPNNSVTYTGRALTPTVTIKDGDKTLVKDTDYTLSYKNNTKTGTATVTVTGKGSYEGTVTKEFTILPKAISSCKGSLSYSTTTYTGKSLTPAVTVKDGNKILVNNTDYTVSYKNNTEPGTATATLSGKGNYTGTASYNFTISKINLSTFAAELSKTAFVYNGKSQRPTVRVKDKNNKYLTSGADYTVSYKNDVNAGTATVTITGAGKYYTGTITKTYTITKANVNFTLTNYTLNLYVGEKFKVTADGGKGTVTWTPKNGKIVSVRVGGRVGEVTALAIGSTEILVKAAGSSNYNSASKTIKVTVKGLQQPKLIAAYNGVKGIGVKFYKEENAAQYVIYRKENGVWSSIKTISATDSALQISGNTIMYTDTTVVNKYGQGYIYSVAAKKGNLISTYDTVGVAIYRLNPPQNPEGVKAGDGKAKITWSKVNCHGYEVQYYQTGTSTWVKCPQTTSLSQVVSGLKKGKKYGFRIRCYKTNASRGTYYSEYTSTFYVTV